MADRARARGRGRKGARGRVDTRPLALSPTHPLALWPALLFCFRCLTVTREHVFQHRTHLHMTVEKLEKAVELV